MRTDERITRAMGELLRRQGYAATGINALARAAEAPTGSLYHHFRGGKREIAAAALRQTGAVYIELLPLLLDPYGDLAEGIEAALAQAGENMRDTGWANMCPVGSVTAEVADVEPELRAVSAEVMRNWLDRGTAYFAKRGLTAEAAREFTHAVLAALEGAFVLARALHTLDPFHAAGRALAAHVRALARAEEAAVRG
ncbi:MULTISPECIES: TetR/AcrR family transcriptional regulator [unclassified Streptomyces]|uniref:TetR/AcrR family transcriptional regulator n=1 Tax=unclassified Streptomyces TaxID=2593676 RepID=UPI00081DDAB7|nr:MULTISPECIES: TetR/AcrR family transcriptional regulator [unclassified Streptomyces]MYR29498.1 TetR family transcriptional regulator [Streptomyces sp. SID4945]SCF46475.1 transcriptional regulator, TetR family [Streptomyces sp. LcepLS]